jgi:hypothetical protein
VFHHQSSVSARATVDKHKPVPFSMKWIDIPRLAFACCDYHLRISELQTDWR